MAKTFDQTEIDRLISEENRDIVTMRGEVYDVTDFMPTHPGKDKIISDGRRWLKAHQAFHREGH